MFDFAARTWHPEPGALAEVVAVPAELVGQGFWLQAPLGLLLHADGSPPTYLGTAASSPAPVQIDDRLLVFPAEPVDWVAEQVPAGAGRVLSFRATLALSDPEQLARALGPGRLATLTVRELAERLAAEPAVRAGLERAWDSPDDSLSIRLRAALAAPLLTTWGLSLVALTDIQRHDARPVESPGPQRPLRVAADGSGDFRTLEEAVAAASTGATIRLGAGTHRLAHPLAIDESLTLVGEGMDRTRVVCDGEDYVLVFDGSGRFTADGITFAHEGRRSANVVVVFEGELDIQRCRFTGEVLDADAKRGGDGLWFQGASRGMVRQCESVSNELDGIVVREQARPTLEGNTCR